jgi:hypothetical protein
MIELEAQHVEDIWYKIETKYRVIFSTDLCPEWGSQADMELGYALTTELQCFLGPTCL